MSAVEKKRQIAEESAKTKKSREKLKKQIESQDKKITRQALEKKKAEIVRWIEHHASDRVVLKAKGISLFDENQNSVEMSLKTQEISMQLSKASSRNDWKGLLNVPEKRASIAKKQSERENKRFVETAKMRNCEASNGCEGNESDSQLPSLARTSFQQRKK